MPVTPFPIRESGGGGAWSAQPALPLRPPPGGGGGGGRAGERWGCFFKSLNGGREVNHFPQAPGARSARLATRIRARRSRAVRAASQPGPPFPVLSRLVHFPQRRALRTCGPAHFPLSPLRPLGPEKEKGADTAFGPPPPFSGEGNRGSWAGLPSGPAFEGYEREDAWAGYRRYDPPGASRRGPSLTQRTMAYAGACSADVSSVSHNWIERIVSYLSLKRASRPLMAGSGACSGLIPVHETSVVGS